jgi:hypothetical protein
MRFITISSCAAHFSGNIKDTLLRVLVNAGIRPGNSFRIAIDDRHIIPRRDFVHFIEEDFWWGPRATVGSDRMEPPPHAANRQPDRKAHRRHSRVAHGYGDADTIIRPV